jgi:hypothetical protein
MSMRRYKLTVVGSVLAWFLVGLHVPALHAMTHDGHTPSPLVLGLTSLLAVAAIAGLWSLLRAPVARRAREDGGTAPS